MPSGQSSTLQPISLTLTTTSIVVEMSTLTQLEVMLPERWRIPLEVCEKVIDEVGNLRYTWVYYRTLTACALVCRSWVPRSRIRLFQKVDLNSRGRASKFLAVLSTAPEFGQLVQTLDIICDEKESGGNGWIYDVLRVLPPLLTNLYDHSIIQTLVFR